MAESANVNVGPEVYQRALQGFITAQQSGAYTQDASNGVNQFVEYWSPYGYNALNDINSLTAQQGVAGTSSPAPVASAPAPSSGSVSAAPANNAIRSAINNSFDTQISGLQSLMDQLAPQRDNATAKITGLFNNNKSQLDAGREASLGRLASDRARTQRDFARAARQVGESGRQALTGFNNQLGTLGASNSSAAFLGAQAIGRDQARVQSDLNSQAQDNFTALDLATNETETNFNLAVQELETWKNNNVLDITQQYQDLQRQISQEMSTADANRQLALAELSQDIANQAASAIRQVATGYQTGINNIGTQVQGPQVRAAVSNDPTISAISGGTVNGIIDTSGRAGGGVTLSSLLPARRDEALRAL